MEISRRDILQKIKQNDRREFLKVGSAALAAAAVSWAGGCGDHVKASLGSASSGAPALTNPQATPAGPVTPASVTVTATPNGSIGDAFAGFSYEKAEMCHPYFRTSNRNLIALFKLLGPSILRIGGDSSDKILYTPYGLGQKYPQVAPSDVARCADFVKAAGWKCLYTVNLAGSAKGTQTPALAAAEVAYAAQQFGSSLYGIEIGNEPDRYGTPGRQYDGRPWSLALYETLWNQYRTAILATTPGVFITGPAAGKLPIWTIPFSVHQTKSKLGLLTDHYYHGTGTSPGVSVADLILPSPRLINNLQMMRAAFQITGIPYRIAECNSYTHGGRFGVSDSYASALWCIDFLFDCAQGGATGANLNGGGMSSYAPLGDNWIDVVAVRPEYYGILFFTMAGSGITYQTKVSAGSLNVTAYAVKTANGLNIVVVNKDVTQNLQLAVQFPQSLKSAQFIAMTQLTAGAAGPDLSANSGIAIQGASVNIDGTFTPAAPYTISPGGNQLSCYVPALTAALIQTTL